MAQSNCGLLMIALVALYFLQIENSLFGPNIIFLAQ